MAEIFAAAQQVWYRYGGFPEPPWLSWRYLWIEVKFRAYGVAGNSLYQFRSVAATVKLEKTAATRITPVAMLHPTMESAGMDRHLRVKATTD